MIQVETIFFEENELIRAANRGGDYENFMIMSTEHPKEYRDFIIVESLHFGDTDHYEDKILTQNDLDDGTIPSTPSCEAVEKLTEDAKKELGKEIGFNGDGYVYICTRADDDFAIGVCVSINPLKKATEEEWGSL